MKQEKIFNIKNKYKLPSKYLTESYSNFKKMLANIYKRNYELVISTTLVLPMFKINKNSFFV